MRQTSFMGCNMHQYWLNLIIIIIIIIIFIRVNIMFYTSQVKTIRLSSKKAGAARLPENLKKFKEIKIPNYGD
jgi:uncharacterized protein YpmB